jgi:hypothetical protein
MVVYDRSLMDRLRAQPGVLIKGDGNLPGAECLDGLQLRRHKVDIGRP